MGKLYRQNIMVNNQLELIMTKYKLKKAKPN